MMQTTDLKDVSINALAVMNHVFNGYVEFITRSLKISMAFICSAIALYYTSLLVSHLYQINNGFFLYFSAVVTVVMSFSFWFFMNCFNSVKQTDTRIDLTCKTKLKFNKILKISFVIKGAFFLILFSSWARVCGNDDSIDLLVTLFMNLSGVEHIFNMVSLDDVKDELKEEDKK
jgi:hypothetical protein